MPYNPKSSRQGMSRRERALEHQKGRMVSIGTGSPLAKDGSEGDFALRKTASGLKLYVKYYVSGLALLYARTACLARIDISLKII